MSSVNLEDNWDKFEHEILTSPTAETTIDEMNVVHVRVFLKARHWIGNKNPIPVHSVTHGMGFLIDLRDMWTIAERCEIPFRKCSGRKCGDDSTQRLEAAMQLVNAQAENASIFYPASTASEAYLQQELRKLHEVIEGKLQLHYAVEAIGEMYKEEG